MKDEIKRRFTRYYKSESTVKTYTRALLKFCNTVNINPIELVDTDKGVRWKEDSPDLMKIEDLTDDFIQDHRTILAPKYLNVIYNAIKSWLFINRKIKSRRLFREIKFDKSSLKTSALLSESLTTVDMKKMFSLANGMDSIDLAFYGLMALRPSLIPFLRVKHIHPRSKELITTVEGKTKIQLKRPCLVIVPAKDESGNWTKGNKAHIDFMTFIPSRITELVEHHLNRPKYYRQTKEDIKNEIPPKLIPLDERRLASSDSKRDVRYIVKKYFALVDKSELSPYRLRNFGNYVLGRIKEKDEDLKEHLMGHKGKISGVYQFRGIMPEQEQEYRTLYQIIDTWIDETIFGSLSETDKKVANVLDIMATNLGTDPTQLAEIRAILDNGKMSLEQYQRRIATVIQKSYNERLESTITEVISRELPKRLEQLQNGDKT